MEWVYEIQDERMGVMKEGYVVDDEIKVRDWKVTHVENVHGVIFGFPVDLCQPQSIS